MPPQGQSKAVQMKDFFTGLLFAVRGSLATWWLVVVCASLHHNFFPQFVPMLFLLWGYRLLLSLHSLPPESPPRADKQT